MSTGGLSGVVEFVAVVSHGSFTAAAEALRVTKSAVSKSVTRLESRLGVKLIHRNTRSISLTAEGELYFASSKAALEQLNLAEEELEVRSNTPSGLLRLTAPISFGQRMLMSLISDMALQYPMLRMEIDFSDKARDLMTEGFDMAIRLGPLPDSTDLVATRLAKQRLIICASPDYLALNGKPQTLKELDSHRCIAGLSADGQQSWLVCEHSGQTLRYDVEPAYSFSNGEAALKAAVSGLGVVQLPDWLCGYALSDGSLVAILDDIEAAPTPISALWPRNRSVLPRVRGMLSYLQDALPQMLEKSRKISIL